MRTTSARQWQCLGILALFVALCIGSGARAQGTSGSLPDPITAAELEGYANRLGLSPQQRQAVQSFHDEYSANFAVLRDSDIENFLKESGNLGRRGGVRMLQDPSAVERGLRDMETIVSKIRALDQQLLDQVQTVLTEQQSARMPGVRMARERLRYRSGLGRIGGFMNPGVRVDLGEIVSEINLSEEDAAIADGVLGPYETAVTAAARKLYEESTNMPATIMKRLQEAGVSAEAFEDPARRGDMFRAFESAWGEAQRTLSAQAREIGDLNRRTARSLAAAISPDPSRTFMNRYVSEAYPQVGSSAQQVENAFGAALGLDGLPESTRTSVLDLRADFRTRDDAIVNEMLTLIDERGGQGPGGGRGGDRGDREDGERGWGGGELREKREQRSTLASSTLEALRGTLGEEYAAQIEQRLAATEDRVELGTITLDGAMLAGAGGGGPVTLTFNGTAATLDVDAEPARNPYVPEPISARAMAQYAAMLGVAEDLRAIVESLHDDYLERYQGLSQGTLKALADAEAAQWKMDDTTGRMRGPTAAEVEAIYGLRSRALGEMLTLDEGLFTDLELALGLDAGSAAMSRVKLARLRDVYNRGTAGGLLGSMFGGDRQRGGGRGGPGGGGGDGGRNRGGGGGPGGGPAMMFGLAGQSDEAAVDVLEVVNRLNLGAGERSSIEPAIAEYEAAAAGLFKAQYDAAIALQMKMDSLAAEAAETMGGDNRDGDRGNRMMAMGGAYREVMEREGKVSTDARAATAAMNRQAIDRMVAALPDVTGRQLRDAYNRRAFPGVYRDDSTALPQLSAAANAPMLTDDQRAQLDELGAEYRGSYAAVCQKMVDVESAMAGAGSPMSRDWTKWQEQQREMEKLRFERNELSEKVRARLRAMLSEEQRAAVPGLDAAGAG